MEIAGADIGQLPVEGGQLGHALRRVKRDLDVGHAACAGRIDEAGYIAPDLRSLHPVVEVDFEQLWPDELALPYIGVIDAAALAVAPVAAVVLWQLDLQIVALARGRASRLQVEPESRLSTHQIVV